MSGKKQKTYDVAIVGCGPVGATLANYFRMFGHSVAIFDRFEKVFPYPRAGGVDDESVRNFQTLGVLEPMQANGDLFEADIWFCDANSKKLGAFDRRHLGDEMLVGESGYHKLSMFHQPNVETILRKAYENSDYVDSYLGYDVLSVTDEGDHTLLQVKELDGDEELEIRALYTVGCDGAKSLVQQALNVGTTDFKYSEDYIVIDAFVEDKAYHRTRFPDGAYFVLDETYAGVVGKAPHGWVRLDFIRHPDSLVHGNLETPEELEQATLALIEARGFDPAKLEIKRIAPYTFEARSPKKWRVGRLLVAGDAAHLTPPWVGQGLNMGMRDAANIAMKINLVLTGKAGDSVLDTYEDERRPVSLKTIEAAIFMGKMMEIKNPIFVAIRNAALRLSGASSMAARAQFSDWQRKPPYNDGFIGKTHDLSGRWMIQPTVVDPQGNRKGLDDLIGLNFALVATTTPIGPSVYRFVQEMGGVVLKLGTDFFDPENRFVDFCNKHRVQNVLMRPDRYIYDAGNDGEALCADFFEKLAGYQSAGSDD